MIMISLTTVAALLAAMISPAMSSRAIGTPIPAPSTYTPKNNRLDCPYAHASKWTGPMNGKWGILCGMDTQSTTYYKGPITDVTFEGCILKCGGANFDCNIATYTAGARPDRGTCYLKKSDKGLGYRNMGDKNYKVAIFLEEGKKDTPAPKGY
ncbi:hypothetical protein PRZ48_009003 [Zasmidium cellare]|uniref:Apple domain-containing protein n=1 Tax=Zasmidium cellare TaxID=395010 RepID=A0ABR0EHU5_ZASCE|nr:hypothetical protein PRZ48_009003 [Zasmidium cellare]